MGRVILDSEKVVAALNRKSLNQRDLARRAGVSETTVSHLVRGIPVSRLKAAQIIRALVDVPDVDGMGEFLPCL